MIFGDAREFAIEAKVTLPTSQPVYGNFSFHLGGIRIGAFDVNCDLSASARWGRTFLSANFRRRRPDLDRTSMNDAFYHVYGRYVTTLSSESALLLDTSDGQEQYIWDRDPYLLDDIGEASIRDEYGLCAIICSDGTDRVIAMNFATSQLSEFIVSEGMVDRVVEQYCSWVESHPAD